MARVRSSSPDAESVRVRRTEHTPRTAAFAGSARRGASAPPAVGSAPGLSVDGYAAPMALGRNSMLATAASSTPKTRIDGSSPPVLSSSCLS